MRSGRGRHAAVCSIAGLLVCVGSVNVGRAQSLAVETSQSVGGSTESTAAAAVQLRGIAEPVRGLRVNVEGAWGDRSRPDSAFRSDVFGTAYPYGGRANVIEAYAEWDRLGRGVRAIKAGRYRTPFGLSSAADHAYIGFLRPPLIRYGGYYALSSGYLEHGVDVLVGVPRLSAEVSLGRPADVGDAIRHPGMNYVARVQAAAGDVIIGTSYIETNPYNPRRFAHGRARFGGIDARWMRGGLQLRGEWIDGQPFDGTTTTGGYLDAIVHTRRMGPVTALVRAEKLGYDTTSPRRLFTHRYGGAMRVRVWPQLAVSVGVSHQGGQLTQRRPTAIDVGATWAWRADLTPEP